MPAPIADLGRLHELNQALESQTPEEVLQSALTAYFPNIVCKQLRAGIGC